MSDTPSGIRALLVDDDPIGAELTVAILREVDPRLVIEVAGDGEEALRMLRARAGDGTDASLPQVVFLDLNMPRLDGHDVLRDIRATPALAAIRVVIFTNSDRPSDVAESLRLGAEAHVAKPVSVEALVARLRGLAHLWHPPSPSL